MTFLYLLLAGFASWVISTVGAGGGAFVLVPIVSFLLGAAAVAPVVTLATMVASPTRVWLFRASIDWRIVRWYLPGALVGAVAGAWLFATAEAEWLQVVIGLFLVSTVVQYRFGHRERTFRVRLWHFLPAGLAVSFVSGLVGAIGPVLNPLYLNFGVVKEGMIATKSLNSLAMHVVKIGTYAALGALTGALFLYGMAAGAGALAANWYAKRLVGKMSPTRFRQVVIAMMVVSGLVMLWRQRETIAGVLGG